MLSHKLRRAIPGSGGITFVDAISGSAQNGGNVTLTLTGLGLIENDLVLIVGGGPRGGASMPATPSTFTSAGITSAGSTALRASYKFMTSTPDTSVVGDGSGNAADATGYVVLAFRGVDLTTPIDATTTTAQDDADASTVPDNPAITTATNGAFVIAAAGSRSNDSSITGPSGYTFDNVVGSMLAHNTDDRNFTMAAAYKEVATAGAEDPGAWSDWTTDRWAALTVALRPA